MIALILLCLTLAPDPFAPPVKGTVMPNGHIIGACEFSGACLGDGWCDGTLDQVECRPATAEGCLYSQTCVEEGFCTWNTVWRACGFEGPDACSPDRGACRINGRCKAAERVPGDSSYVHCVATREGCENSEACRTWGLCQIGNKSQFLCRASQRGCRESLNCKRYGDCVPSPDGRGCIANKSSCPASVGCKEFGKCSPVGKKSYMFCGGSRETENLASARDCAVYGVCSLASRPCSYRGGAGCYVNVPAPSRPGDCEKSEICARFGACTATRRQCWVVPEFPECELERIPNVKVTASSVHGRWDEYTFDPANLLDGVPKTVWQAGIEGNGPHYLTFTFDAPLAVAGFEFANGFHHVNPRLGVLLERFSAVRGYAVLVPRDKDGKQTGSRRSADLDGYIVHEAFRSGEGFDMYTQPFEPVMTDRIVVQLFENLHGTIADFTSVSELAPMRCKASTAVKHDGAP